MSATLDKTTEIKAILGASDIPDVRKVEMIREIINQINPETCSSEKLYRIRIRSNGHETVGWRGDPNSHSDAHWCVKPKGNGMYWVGDRHVTVLGPVGGEENALTVGASFTTFHALCAAAESDGIIPDGDVNQIVVRDNDGDLGHLSWRRSHGEWVLYGRASRQEGYSPWTVVEINN